MAPTKETPSMTMAIEKYIKASKNKNNLLLIKVDKIFQNIKIIKFVLMIFSFRKPIFAKISHKNSIILLHK
jgi:hypothetical protein